MAPHQHSRAGFTLLEICCIVVFVSILIAVTITLTQPGCRIANDRSASTSLRTLSTAEADFRVNDRDWNHVNDFWTGDVKGLWTLTSAAVRGAAGNTTTDPSIKLIELSLASADADGNLVPAGGENAPLASFAVPSPKAAYWVAALDTDRSVGIGTPESFYRQDTQGDLPMGRCHNLTRFGFVTFPDSASSGKFVFIVNQNNTIYRAAASGINFNARPTPPGVQGLPAEFRNWPTSQELNASWTKLD